MYKLINTLLVVAALAAAVPSAQAQTAEQGDTNTATLIQAEKNELASLNQNLETAKHLRDRYIIVGLSTTVLDAGYFVFGSALLTVMSDVANETTWYKVMATTFLPVVVGTAGYSGYNYYRFFKVKRDEIPTLQKEIQDAQDQLDAAQRAQSNL